MKKVINTESSVIHRSALNENSVIGVCQRNAGGHMSKGFYARSEYRSGEYALLCCAHVNQGNRWTSSIVPCGQSGFPTFEGLLDYIFGAAIPFEVFVFEDTKELFKWLAE